MAESMAHHRILRRANPSRNSLRPQTAFERQRARSAGPFPHRRRLQWSFFSRHIVSVTLASPALASGSIPDRELLVVLLTNRVNPNGRENQKDGANGAQPSTDGRHASTGLRNGSRPSEIGI